MQSTVSVVYNYKYVPLSLVDIPVLKTLNEVQAHAHAALGPSLGDNGKGNL